MSEIRDFSSTIEPLPCVSYKEGWEFELHRPGFSTTLGRMDGGMAEIHVILSDLPQCPEKGLTIPSLHFRYAVDAGCVEPEHLSMTIRAVVNAIEAHETDEWLFVDGERVTDPHPDKFISSGGHRPLVNPLEGITCG